jgi:hypothetical protein
VAVNSFSALYEGGVNLRNDRGLSAALEARKCPRCPAGS